MISRRVRLPKLLTRSRPSEARAKPNYTSLSSGIDKDRLMGVWGFGGGQTTPQKIPCHSFVMQCAFPEGYDSIDFRRCDLSQSANCSDQLLGRRALFFHSLFPSLPSLLSLLRHCFSSLPPFSSPSNTALSVNVRSHCHPFPHSLTHPLQVYSNFYTPLPPLSPPLYPSVSPTLSVCLLPPPISSYPHRLQLPPSPPLPTFCVISITH